MRLSSLFELAKRGNSTVEQVNRPFSSELKLALKDFPSRNSYRSRWDSKSLKSEKRIELLQKTLKIHQSTSNFAVKKELTLKRY